MRGTIEGIPEGLAFGLQIPRDKDTSRSLILVHFELDGQAQIFENRVRHGVEYPPVIGSFLGLFALDDSRDGITLLRRGAAIDYGLHGATALKDGTRPLEDQSDGYPGQIHVTKVTFVDPKHLDSFAALQLLKLSP
jgi:hypothetical protein